MKNLILVLIFAVFTGCDNFLPLPSKNGKNIFGCKIDGQTLRTTKINLLSDNPLFAKMTDSSFYVTGDDYNDRIAVLINVSRINKKGKFNLDQHNNAMYIDNNYPGKYYSTTQKYTGQVNVTRFDYKNKVISGTFEFEAVNKKDSTDVVKVTRGRFDVDLNTLK